MMSENRLLRRPKQGPNRDMLHVLRIGGVLGIVLMLTLPWIFPVIIGG